MTLLLTTATTLVGLVIAAQLLVAASAKVSGWTAYTRLSGTPIALGLVAVEVVLSLWIGLGLIATRAAFATVALFYAAGSIHRALTVLNPRRTICLCASSRATVTTWHDVGAAVILSAGASTIAWFGPARPEAAQAIFALVAIGYATAWAHALFIRSRTHAGPSSIAAVRAGG